MRTTRESKGHTLLELLIVTILASVVFLLTVKAFGPMTRSTLNARDRAGAAGEMRLAVSSLLQDLGGADTALPLGSDLHIVRDREVAELQGAWGGGDDDGITYSLSGDRLRRWDQESDTDVVVARSITAFEVTRVGGETRVAITAGVDAGERSVELVWPR